MCKLRTSHYLWKWRHKKEKCLVCIKEMIENIKLRNAEDIVTSWKLVMTRHKCYIKYHASYQIFIQSILKGMYSTESFRWFLLKWQIHCYWNMNFKNSFKIHCYWIWHFLKYSEIHCYWKYFKLWSFKVFRWF